MTETDDTTPAVLDTTPAGLDAFADSLASELNLSREGRDRLRAKLAQLENVYWDEEHGVPVRLVEHETVGDWTRATVRPFLRPVN